MADPHKRNHSSASEKEKDPLQDLEIGNDFFSWKSISMADGDALDFDLTPVSKGNKKPFNFGKADMDFNLDTDFAKISSFNLDMSDLEISPPLKKDAKSKEKPGESSSGKDKRKTDHFAFGFDFDELENFSFDPSTEKGTKAERDKNNKKDSPNESGCQDKEDSVHINETGSGSTLKDAPQKPSLPETRITFNMDCIVGATDLESIRDIFPSNSAKDEGVTPKHPVSIDAGVSDQAKSPLETTISMEIPNASPSKRLVSPGKVDLEACTKNDDMPDLSSDSFSSNEPSGRNSSAAETVDTNANGSKGEQDVNMTLAADYACNYKHTVSRNSQHLQAVISENIEPSGGDSSTAENKVSCMDTEVTGSNGEQDADLILVAGSTCIDEHTSNKSQHLQAVTSSENICGERTQGGTEDHVEDDRGRTEICQTNSHVANSCTTSTVSGTPDDTQCSRENQEPALETLKSSFVSRPADSPEIQTEKTKEPLINCSRPSIQSDKPEYPVLKASNQTMFSSLSSKQMGFAQPSLVEGRAGDATQRDRKLASLSLQCSKTLLMGKIPQIQSQQSCNSLKIHEVAPIVDSLHNGSKLNNTSTAQVMDIVKTKSAPRERDECTKDLDTLRDAPIADKPGNGSKLNDSSISQVRDMVKTKSAPRQREQCTKDLDTLRMETNRKAAENRGNPKNLASIPSNKNTPAQGHMTRSIEGSRKAPDLPGPKLSRLSIDSTKSPIWRESKSVETSSQKSVLLSKSLPGIAHIPEKRKQTSSFLSTKRTLEDASADAIALYPSKRLSQSTATSRSYVEISEKFLDKKAPSHSRVEDDCIKRTGGNCQVTPFGKPHEVKTKGVEIIISPTRNDSNIKLADACSQELDNLCDILRKKHEEAKELLVRAIVNCNKMLMLNNPHFKEKIRVTQDMFARLTLNSIHG